MIDSLVSFGFNAFFIMVAISAIAVIFAFLILSVIAFMAGTINSAKDTETKKREFQGILILIFGAGLMLVLFFLGVNNGWLALLLMALLTLLSFRYFK